MPLCASWFLMSSVSNNYCSPNYGAARLNECIYTKRFSMGCDSTLTHFMHENFCTPLLQGYDSCGTYNPIWLGGYATRKFPMTLHRLFGSRNFFKTRIIGLSLSKTVLLNLCSLSE